MRVVSVAMERLAAALRVAQTATGRVVPILQCVRISIDAGDLLQIEAGNGSASMRLRVRAGSVSRDDGSPLDWARVVSPRALLAALRLGGEVDTVELRNVGNEDGSGEALEVVMGSARARIPSLPDTAWPMVEREPSDDPLPQCLMRPGELRAALRGAVVAASVEAGRALAGVHMTIDDDHFARLTCTDGRRLHRQRLFARDIMHWDAAAPQVLLQGCDVPMAAAWLSSLAEAEESADGQDTAKQVLSVRCEPRTLLLYGPAWGAEQILRLPLMDGRYPSADAVIPDWREKHHRIVLESKGIALPVVEALGAMVSADQETRSTAIIELHAVAPGSLTISARPYVSRASGMGHAGTLVSAHVEAIWPEREIPPVALDAAFLAEALQAAGSGEVTIEIWQDEGQTEIATAVTISTTGTLAVVMPMRT